MKITISDNHNKTMSEYDAYIVVKSLIEKHEKEIARLSIFFLEQEKKLNKKIKILESKL